MLIQALIARSLTCRRSRDELPPSRAFSPSITAVR
jgi:hypothetical protein